MAFLSRLLEANVDVRFADLPQIEGATGRFLLQQMVAVAELEAGMISARTKAALAAARRRGVKLGGMRHKDGMIPPAIAALAGGRGREVQAQRARERARVLRPTIEALQASGVTDLKQIAAGLNDMGIPAARGGAWGATQVRRVINRL